MWIHNVEFPHVHIYTFDSVDDVEFECGCCVEFMCGFMWIRCGCFVDVVWSLCG